jgi:hypothetical protein
VPVFVLCMCVCELLDAIRSHGLCTFCMSGRCGAGELLAAGVCVCVSVRVRLCVHVRAYVCACVHEFWSLGASKFGAVRMLQKLDRCACFLCA